VKRIEAMSVEELSTKVAAEQSSYDRNSSFLAMQEEEAADLEGQIADLRSQMQVEKDFAKKIEMEAELSSLQEEYDSQEESLSGQRLSLQNQLSMLNLMKSILERKQGNITGDDSLQALTVMLGQIEDQKQRLTEEVQRLEGQVSAIRSHYQRQQEQLRQQQLQQQQVLQALQSEQDELIVKSRTLGALVSKVATQEAILRPIQDIVDAVRPTLENARASGNSDLQEVVHQLRQLLHSLAQG
jgi:chromosome segregation ATPase